MALIDLITSARAYQSLPSAMQSGPDYNSVITLITACSRAIVRYCKRSFIVDSYDELYNGRGERQLILRNYPIQTVQSVRYRPVTVSKITCTDSSGNTPQARAEVLSPPNYTAAGGFGGAGGVRLTRVTLGVRRQTLIPFAGNATLGNLESTITAADSGFWFAVGQGYDNWPSADLWCANGSTQDYTANNAAQGALQCVAGSFAELKMHTFELQGYQINARHGGLLRAIPYTDPELLHPEDLIWPVGVNNFRIQYTAGYTTIPEDVQEACAQLVAYNFRLDAREAPDTVIPPIIAQMLAPYRSHLITMPGG